VSHVKGLYSVPKVMVKVGWRRSPARKSLATEMHLPVGRVIGHLAALQTGAVRDKTGESLEPGGGGLWMPG
jgi:hypothetical protein